MAMMPAMNTLQETIIGDMMNNNNPSVIKNGNHYKVLDSFYVYAGDLQDNYVQLECRESGIWDKNLTKWMLENIKPGWTCLDIGANTFYFTEIMARLVGLNGKVIAFEPIKYLYDNYLISQKLNDYTNAGKIIVHQKALSNESRSGSITVYSENVGGSQIADQPEYGLYETWPNQRVEEISLVKLQDIYDDNVDFIKIDVEGHEELAFEGFGQKVKNCPLIVIELGRRQNPKFLEYLKDNYIMSLLSGEETNLDYINSCQVVDIVLRKKDRNVS